MPTPDALPEPGRRHRSWAWAVWTIAAVASYAYANRSYGANLFFDDQSAARVLGKATLIVAGFTSLVLGPLALRGRLALGSILALCIASMTANFAVNRLMSEQLTRDTAIWLFSERHQAGNVWAVWWAVILQLTALAGLLLWTMRPMAVRLRSWLERQAGARVANAVRALAMAAFLLIPATLVAGRFQGGLAETSLYAFAVDAMLTGDPEAPVLDLQPTGAPKARNIVLLMDESTRHEAFAKVVAPSLPGAAIDYRHAYSISGCSAASNALMRWGLARGEGLAGDPRLNPSLWAYARNAGFRRVMIDGQMTTTKDSHNLFLGSEFDLIDDRRAMEAGVETDQGIARAVAALTREPGPRFIYVVLRGNHVPYARNNLPPALQGLGGGLRADYERSVGYTTGRFFATLLHEQGVDPDTAIFYTSDHGQDLSGGVTHCRSHAPEDDFEVPMVIVPGPSSDWAEALRRARPCWEGGASHVNLRSTVLEAMGYDRDTVEREGFTSLTHCPDDRRMPRFRGEMPFVSVKGDKLRYEMLPFRSR